jgi:hypothetical protein
MSKCFGGQKWDVGLSGVWKGNLEFLLHLLQYKNYQDTKIIVINWQVNDNKCETNCTLAFLSNFMQFVSYINNLLAQKSSIMCYCHNPTNNPKQPKTFVGVVLLSVKNPHTTTTTTPPQCDYNKGSSRQPRKMIFGMQSYFNPTR